MDLVTEFQDYANSLRSGYIKTWKAASIISTLRQLPKILDDEVRFLNYLKNCLQMEGFSDIDTELAMGWLFERKERIVSC